MVVAVCWAATSNKIDDNVLAVLSQFKAEHGFVVFSPQRPNVFSSNRVGGKNPAKPFSRNFPLFSISN